MAEALICHFCGADNSAWGFAQASRGGNFGGDRVRQSTEAITTLCYGGFIAAQLCKKINFCADYGGEAGANAIGQNNLVFDFG
ncbi:hypothetical protein [Oscillatoria sp. HE19RPO]|uniref:hypothetical protein n=1 Tax=Oscillatoria sp. HE19RPO TaxID=2954806 RepID=UPI0020C4F4C6|nr:hypothetical protein [Oscillatoria sp. HE19RPO]